MTVLEDTDSHKTVLISGEGWESIQVTPKNPVGDLSDLLARSGRVVVPEGVWRLDPDNRLPSGLHLTGEPGAVVEVVDDGSKTGGCINLVGAEDVTIDHLTVRSTGTGRTSVYGLIRAEDCGNIDLSHLRLLGGTSCGVWTMEVDGLHLSQIVVDGPAADGYHLSRNTRNVTAAGLVALNTGDDGFAVNSYPTTGNLTHEPCASISLAGFVARNVGVGRGVALNGAYDTAVSNVTVSGCDQAGVLVSLSAGSVRSRDVCVTGMVLRDVGRNVPEGGVGHGVYVAESDGVLVDGVLVDGTPYDGVRTASNVTDVTVGDVLARNFGGVAVGTG